MTIVRAWVLRLACGSEQPLQLSFKHAHVTAADVSGAKQLAPLTGESNVAHLPRVACPLRKQRGIFAQQALVLGAQLVPLGSDHGDRLGAALHLRGAQAWQPRADVSSGAC